jgi:beta-mannanase
MNFPQRLATAIKNTIATHPNLNPTHTNTRPWNHTITTADGDTITINSARTGAITVTHDNHIGDTLSHTTFNTNNPDTIAAHLDHILTTIGSDHGHTWNILTHTNTPTAQALISACSHALTPHTLDKIARILN